MKLKCKCGYEWDFKGRLSKATCPNCSNKVVVNLGKKKDDNKH